MSQQSEFNSPQAPQTEFSNSGHTNIPAHIEAYTDRTLTDRNVIPTDTVPTPQPTPSGSTTLGAITVYDPPNTNHTPDNDGAVTPPHSPNSWKPGRDPYKNNGMVGQDFFRNGG